MGALLTGRVDGLESGSSWHRVEEMGGGTVCVRQENGEHK